MEELLSYRLADLLLFSESTYLRQFERYNQWLYPGQYIAAIYGLLVPVFITRFNFLLNRMLFIIQGLCWLLTAYGFLWQFYQSINWIASYFIPVFIIQGLIFLGTGFKQHLVLAKGRTLFSGLILWSLALILNPVLELATQRNFSELSCFLLTPDLIAVTSVATMMLFNQKWFWFIPSCSWLVFSLLTYLAMESYSALIPGVSLIVIMVYLLTPLNRLSVDK
ncbi:MAG: hypothetical protein OEY09_17230 [Gammaproteobacteria bacterium]|nr:hypothetical protein [Gammaproteobacteria bacterium]